MDEPTEGLAPSLVAEVGRLIGQLRQEGTSVLLVEQSAAFAVQMSDYAHVMSQGAIVHSSEPEALWENEEIKTQYLGVPGRAKRQDRNGNQDRARNRAQQSIPDRVLIPFRPDFTRGAAGRANLAASIATFGCTSLISNVSRPSSHVTVQRTASSRRPRRDSPRSRSASEAARPANRRSGPVARARPDSMSK